jgi:hypothetical protein
MDDLLLDPLSAELRNRMQHALDQAAVLDKRYTTIEEAVADLALRHRYGLRSVYVQSGHPILIRVTRHEDETRFLLTIDGGDHPVSEPFSTVEELERLLDLAPSDGECVGWSEARESLLVPVREMIDGEKWYDELMASLTPEEHENFRAAILDGIDASENAKTFSPEEVMAYIESQREIRDKWMRSLSLDAASAVNRPVRAGMLAEPEGKGPLLKVRRNGSLMANCIRYGSDHARVWLDVGNTVRVVGDRESDPDDVLFHQVVAVVKGG